MPKPAKYSKKNKTAARRRSKRITHEIVQSGGNATFLRSIAGLTMWYDATDINGDGTAISNSTNLTTWKDKSGNLYNLTARDGTAAQYNTTICNNRPGVAFFKDNGQTTEAGGTFLGNGFTNSSVPTSQYVTIFAVVTPTMVVSDSGKNTITGEILDSLGSKWWYCLRLYQPSSGKVFTESPTFFQGASTTSLNNMRPPQPFLVTFVSNSSGQQIIVNANGIDSTVTAGAITSAAPGAQPIYVGYCPPMGAGRLNGAISEILQYNAALSYLNILKVQGYLAIKWGLAPYLPTRHPYYNATSFESVSYNPPIPLRFSGLTLWVDANDLNGNNTNPASNVGITAWADKSGSGNNLISLSAGGATGDLAGYYNPTIASGKAGVTFGSPTWNNLPITADGFITPSYLPVVASTTYFVVYTPYGANNSTNTMGTIFGQNAKGSNPLNTLMLQVFSNTPTFFEILNDPQPNAEGVMTGLSPKNNRLMGNASIPVGTTVLISYVATGSQRIGSVYGNGYKYEPSSDSWSGTGAGSLPLVVGAEGRGFQANGSISELLYYKNPLSTDEIQQVQGYLAAKWGIAKYLPTTHPYYDSVYDPVSGTPMSAAEAAAAAAKVASAATYNTASRATFQGASTARFQGDSRATFQGASAAQYQGDSRAQFQGASTARFQGDSRATFQGASAASFQGASAANFQNASTARFQADSRAQFQGASTAVYQAASAAQLIKDSGATFQRDSRANYQGASTANFQADSRANFQGDSRANFIGASAANFQNASTARFQADSKAQFQNESGSTYISNLTKPYITSLGNSMKAIPGIQLWLDSADPAATGTAPAVGSAVSTWVDKSGVGNNATGVGSPTYSAAGIRFDGSSQYFSTNLTSHAPTESAFAVVSLKTLDTPSGILGFDRIRGREWWVVGGTMSWKSEIAEDRMLGGTLSTGVQTLCAQLYSGGTVTAFLNGTQALSQGGSVGSATGGTLIGSYGNGALLNGTISEIVVFNTALTVPQRQLVEGYLANKWNIPLPTAHPYAGNNLIASSGANFQAASAATFQGASAAQLVTDSRAQFIGDSRANFQRDSRANFQGDSKATYQGASAASFQGASTATYEGASSALYQRASTASFEAASAPTYQRASTATYEGASAASFQGASTALYQRASTATFQAASAPTYQRASAAQLINDSRAQFVGDSRANFQGDSKAQLISDSRAQFVGDSGAQFVGDSRASFNTASGSTATVNILADLLVTPVTEMLPGVQPVLWFDAGDPNGDGSSLGEGALITTWKDKSRGNTAKSTGVTEPIYTVSSGHPAVQFFGTQSLTLLLDATPVTTPFTIFVVASINDWNTNAGGNGRIVSFGSSGSEVLALNTNSNTPAIVGITTPSATFIAQTTTPTTTIPYIWQASVTSSSINVEGIVPDVKGGAFQTVSMPSTDYNILSIGNAVDGTDSQLALDGNISEIIIFNTSLTKDQQQTIEGYLSWKWGLQNNLPATHPFAASVATLSASSARYAGVSSAQYVALTTLTNVGQLIKTPVTTLITTKPVMWFDATDPTGTGVAPANNSIVTSWMDKSGRGNHANVSGTTTNVGGLITVGKTPSNIYNASGLNGKPAIQFNGSQYFMGNLQTGSFSGQAQIFIVFSANSAGTNSRILSLGAGTGTTSDVANTAYAGFVYKTSPTGPNVGFFRNSIPSFSGISSAWSAPFLWEGSITNTSTSVTGLTGGVPQTRQSALIGALTPTSFAIGANTNLGGTDAGVRAAGLASYLNGNIAEMIVYNTTLVPSDIATIEAYLSWKWGIQMNLPPNNPYYPTSNVQNESAAISKDASQAAYKQVSGATYNKVSGSSYLGASTANYQGASAAQLQQLSGAKYLQDSRANFQQDSRANFQGASTANFEGASAANFQGASTANFQQLSGANFQGASTANYTADSRAQFQQDSAASFQGSQQSSGAQYLSASTSTYQGASTAQLQQDSAATFQGASSARYEGASTANYIGDSRANFLQDSRANLQQDSAATFQGASAAKYESVSAANYIGDSRANFQKDSAAHFQKDSAATFIGASTAMASSAQVLQGIGNDPSSGKFVTPSTTDITQSIDLTTNYKSGYNARYVVVRAPTYMGDGLLNLSQVMVYDSTFSLANPINVALGKLVYATSNQPKASILTNGTTTAQSAPNVWESATLNPAYEYIEIDLGMPINVYAVNLIGRNDCRVGDMKCPNRMNNLRVEFSMTPSKQGSTYFNSQLSASSALFQSASAAQNIRDSSAQFQQDSAASFQGSQQSSGAQYLAASSSSYLGASTAQLQQDSAASFNSASTANYQAASAANYVADSRANFQKDSAASFQKDSGASFLEASSATASSAKVFQDLGNDPKSGRFVTPASPPDTAVEDQTIVMASLGLLSGYRARYIIIRAPSFMGDGVLNLSQVLIYDKTFPTVNKNNIAINRPVFATSNQQDTTLLTDGSTKVRVAPNVWQSATPDPTSEYLEIDLGSVQNVYGIRLLGRDDCDPSNPLCPSRMRNVRVEMSLTPSALAAPYLSDQSAMITVSAAKASSATFQGASAAKYEGASAANYAADSRANFQQDSRAQFQQDSAATLEAASAAKYESASAANFQKDSAAQYGKDSSAQLQKDSGSSFLAASSATASSAQVFQAVGNDPSSGRVVTPASPSDAAVEDQTVILSALGLKGGYRARYIVIRAPAYMGDGVLNLSQIMVYDSTFGTTKKNIALGRTVFATSNQEVAPILTDGSKDVRIAPNVWQSATPDPNSEYLEIDLGSVQNVYAIRLLGRDDCDPSDRDCPNRMRNVRIEMNLTPSASAAPYFIEQAAAIALSGATASSAKFQGASTANYEGASTANYVADSRANFQKDSAANLQQDSAATFQGASAARYEGASTANYVADSRANFQQDSAANLQQDSAATFQGASAARYEGASTANFQKDSGAQQMNDSAANYQELSGASFLSASSATASSAQVFQEVGNDPKFGRFVTPASPPDEEIEDQLISMALLGIRAGYRARYIVIRAPSFMGDGILNLSQVIVYDKTFPTIHKTNIAFGKTVFATSNQEHASLLTDGSTEVRVRPDVWYSATPDPSSEYLEIDLGSVQSVYAIRLLGRDDCDPDNPLCPSRMRNVRIEMNMTPSASAEPYFIAQSTALALSGATASSANFLGASTAQFLGASTAQQIAAEELTASTASVSAAQQVAAEILTASSALAASSAQALSNYGDDPENGLFVLPTADNVQEIPVNLYKGRYVRVMPSAYKGDGYLNISQIMICDQTGVDNVAIGRPVYATSSFSADPSIVVDGHPAPRGASKFWESSSNDRSIEFIEVDLGSEQTITAIRLIGRNDCPPRLPLCTERMLQVRIQISSVTSPEAEAAYAAQAAALQASSANASSAQYQAAEDFTTSGANASSAEFAVASAADASSAQYITDEAFTASAADASTAQYTAYKELSESAAYASGAQLNAAIGMDPAKGMFIFPNKTNDQTIMTSGATGRYVRIRPSLNNADGYIHLSQVAVFDRSGNNIAMGKPTYSTSFYPGTSDCSIVTDGILAPRNPPNIWHTMSKNRSSEFVEIDLGSAKSIYFVRVCGRQDCPIVYAGCQERMYEMRLEINMTTTQDALNGFVTNVLTSVPSTTVSAKAQAMAIGRYVLPTNANDQTIVTNGATGRYVRVRPSAKRGDGYINISQIIVNDMNGENISKSKRVYASSSSATTQSPSIVVDGSITARNFPDLWQSKTNNRDAEFIEIDLGSSQAISSIEILGRADCTFASWCEDRMAELRVELNDQTTEDFPQSYSEDAPEPQPQAQPQVQPQVQNQIYDETTVQQMIQTAVQQAVQQVSQVSQKMPDPPVYEKSVYQPSVYEKSVYQPPVYEKSVYQPPVYEKSVYEQPVYQQPVYQQPVYEQPVYQQPVYQQPVQAPQQQTVTVNSMSTGTPVSIADTSSHVTITRKDITLPPGYLRKWDSKTRNYVFYDENGQIVSHPSLPRQRVDTSAVKRPAQGGGKFINIGGKKKSVQKGGFTPLATDVKITNDPTVTSPWSKYFDTLKRQYYYHNNSNGNAVWVHPFLPRQPVPGELKYGDAGLPSDWEKYLESSVNTYFYYDPKTGETTWEHPNPPPFPADDAEAVKATGVTGPYVMYRDSATNSLFFFNTDTTETFWVLPRP